MSRRVLCRHYNNHQEMWQLVRTSFGLLVEDPLGRFVILTPEAAKVIGNALTVAAIAHP